MLMKILKQHASRRKLPERGFSLLEMVTVMALIIVMASVSFISLIPALKQQRVTSAYNTTLSAMRLARDNAVAQRTSYKVTFTTTTSPYRSTIKVEPTLAFTGAQTTATYQLPTDVAFITQTGFPAAAPDNYGTGATAIDFGYTASNTTGGSQVVYFCPDGSAQDDATGSCLGNADGGVVYIARSGDLLSSRAVSLWGTTGRIRGWRLYPNGGTYQWQRQ